MIDRDTCEHCQKSTEFENPKDLNEETLECDDGIWKIGSITCPHCGMRMEIYNFCDMSFDEDGENDLQD